MADAETMFTFSDNKQEEILRIGKDASGRYFIVVHGDVHEPAKAFWDLVKAHIEAYEEGTLEVVPNDK